MMFWNQQDESWISTSDWFGSTSRKGTSSEVHPAQILANCCCLLSSCIITIVTSNCAIVSNSLALLPLRRQESLIAIYPVRCAVQDIWTQQIRKRPRTDSQRQNDCLCSSCVTQILNDWCTGSCTKGVKLVWVTKLTIKLVRQCRKDFPANCCCFASILKDDIAELCQAAGTFQKRENWILASFYLMRLEMPSSNPPQQGSFDICVDRICMNELLHANEAKEHTEAPGYDQGLEADFGRGLKWNSNHFASVASSVDFPCDNEFAKGMSHAMTAVNEVYAGKVQSSWSSDGHLLRDTHDTVIKFVVRHISAAFIPADKTSDDYHRFQVRSKAAI